MKWVYFLSEERLFVSTGRTDLHNVHLCAGGIGGKTVTLISKMKEKLEPSLENARFS